MQKFFVKDNQITESIIEIIGTDVNHITNVLRLNVDEEILVCNVDKGISYKTKIIDIDKEMVRCKIIEKIEERNRTKYRYYYFPRTTKSRKNGTNYTKMY